MPSTFGFDTSRYLDLMVAINDRFARALDHLRGAHGDKLSYLSAEEFALQVRMICESILASSFIMHRSKYVQIIGKVTNPNKPSSLVLDLRHLNPGFMPHAVRVEVDEHGKVGFSIDFPHQIDANFLIKIHGICGNFVHLLSAIEKPPKLSKFRNEFDRFLTWMNWYLAGHQISFFPSLQTYLFDGAGVVNGKPALLSLDTEGSSLKLILVRADKSAPKKA